MGLLQRTTNETIYFLLCLVYLVLSKLIEIPNLYFIKMEEIFIYLANTTLKEQKNKFKPLKNFG